MKAPLVWAPCWCNHSANDHESVIVRVICVDPGGRILFEGTLGACAMERFEREMSP